MRATVPRMSKHQARITLLRKRPRKCYAACRSLRAKASSHQATTPNGCLQCPYLIGSHRWLGILFCWLLPSCAAAIPPGLINYQEPRKCVAGDIWTCSASFSSPAKRNQETPWQWRLMLQCGNSTRAPVSATQLRIHSAIGNEDKIHGSTRDRPRHSPLCRQRTPSTAVLRIIFRLLQGVKPSKPPVPLHRSLPRWTDRTFVYTVSGFTLLTTAGYCWACKQA
ncbi:hypothetical protein BD289DRAFT_14778 [Coniella lustricola]|uniref:Uncharacterized protein n=1 Tax=Coniella lustricola TaxID=2025994 RepID=A0A2T3A449_9PEZI|nr:hypothetical protein BD289DRAFT_14778 [Coniella lustricola]